ncbi:ABC transporter ATP-binding protein [Marinomonas primoryensis]|uniref:ABC transporter ATP-binding protein n=1 Tax=Marinomonas primoryensis TaxID=178399 RepID=A0ABV0L1Q6_9GAMM
MSELLKVEGVWKKYSRDLKASIKYGAQDIFSGAKSQQNARGKLRETEFWALSNVNFTLQRGEVLAVLGHNGAGKSTLLKCIAGKLRHDHGSITRNGDLGHLLEMSAGFSPTMTGRDNITVRGQLLGKSGKELDHYIAAVEEFAEIDEFFDAPVQFYSSGMKSRLGFAASSTIEPDILILDEVLAVGDLGFRMKCYSRIDELRKNCAVILVTHSMGHVGRMADSALLLEKGKVIYEGDPQQGIELYQDAVSNSAKLKPGISFMPERVSFGLYVGGSEVENGGSVDFGAAVTVKGKNLFDSKLSVSVILHEQGGSAIAEWNSKRNDFYVLSNEVFSAELGPLNLCPGYYHIALVGFDGGEQVFLSEVFRFKIAGDFFNNIRFQPVAEWH